MPTGDQQAPDRTPDGRAPRRRPRYRGTHPRRFDHRYKELQPHLYPEIQDRVRARGGTPAGTHVPVLVAEVLDCLQPAPGDVVVDCTLGYGGHAIRFLDCIGPTGRLVGFDVDGRQLHRTAKRLAAATNLAVEPHAAGARANGLRIGPRIHLYHGNFAGLGRALKDLALAGFDVVFADLGVSSMQLDDPARGFSYKHDGPLDMRMDDRISRTAADWLREMSRDELSSALRDLADEPDHERIADAVVRFREREPITRTAQVVRLCLDAKHIPSRPRADVTGTRRTLHPAARVFQALRILVNDELGSLAQFLRSVPYCLRPGGRVGVISFHSGEDRLVKKAFRAGLREGIYGAISENVIRPGPRERRDNPRSAPAKLRWARARADAP